MNLRRALDPFYVVASWLMFAAIHRGMSINISPPRCAPRPNKYLARRFRSPVSVTLVTSRGTGGYYVSSTYYTCIGLLVLIHDAEVYG